MAASTTPTTLADLVPGTESIAALEAEHHDLATRVAGLTFDLGGLAFEMAIRNQYRVEVLASRAAELHGAEAALGAVERRLAAARDGITGACRACGAVHSRGAVYCWKCGTPLLADHPVAGHLLSPRR
jgi:ribosomal protein L40E